MTMRQITIDGEAYPCYPTAGAMLRFKDLTGEEVTVLSKGGISDFMKYLFCCVQSACSREKKELPYTCQEFFDMVDPDVMNAWQKSLSEESQEGTEEKKSR